MKNKQKINLWGWLCLASALLGAAQPINATGEDRSTINPVLLSPTAPAFYGKLQKEFDALEHSTARSPDEESRGVVCLSRADNIERAPKLYAFLNHVATKLAKKAGIKVPTIFVCVKLDSSSYNASVQKIIYTSRLTYTSETGSSITTEIVNDEFNLTVGKELINLFFWNSANKDCIEAVIAHEIGHAMNNHTVQSKENEFEADAAALRMLEVQENLPRAIDMLTLAGHIYNNLAAIASEALKEHVHFLIRVMTTSLIQEFPDLGRLGSSSSHTNFAFAVNAALEPILNPMATGGQPINAAHVVISAYNRLKQACVEPEQLLRGDKRKLSAQGKLLDELTSRFFSPINHPDPRSRKRHMRECMGVEMETAV